jgi:hypothetical protein
MGTTPLIWRRFQVPDCTLSDIHNVIQVVMGWDDSHLHDFEIGGSHYVPRTPYGGEELDGEDEAAVTLSSVFSEKARFTYTYDYGDTWEHQLVLEKSLKPEKTLAHPACLEGEHACPPEDCGSVWGFADFLQAISDREHPDHKEMLEWGGKFDPEKFDLKGFNRTFKRWR